MDLHRTLGHLNRKQSEKVVKTSNGLAMVGNVDRDTCGVCTASKLIIRKICNSKALGEVIHADLGFFDEERDSGVKSWVRSINHITPSRPSQDGTD